jgi:F-type H+-transporting ATPase subunit b
MENAEQIKAELAETQAERDKVLAEANQKAQEMIADAKEAAQQVGEAEGQKAVKQAEEIIRKAREATDADRDQMMSELKAEIGRLVVETTAKVSGKVLTAEDQQRLIDDTNRELAA